MTRDVGERGDAAEASVVAALAGGGRVHLVGIGGAGMSALARVMLDRGSAVSGSDARASATTDALAGRGAAVRIGHEGTAVAGASVVVVSSAVRGDNPEVLTARSAGVPVVHRSAALAALMAGRRAVTITGTHGKTTTTSMTVMGARGAGCDAGYAIGGDLAGDGINARDGAADVFVAEADESDGSFVAYRPTVCVVGNVEPDHLDHYGSAQAVAAAFDALSVRLLPGGHAVAGVDDPGARRWAATVRTQRPDLRVWGVGRGSDADVRIRDEEDLPDGGRARVTVNGEPGTEAWLSPAVPGRHNITNAALAWTACVLGLGLSPEAVARGIAAFMGTRRRLEPRGEIAGVRVLDDYAHHPTEVTATLSALRTVAGHGRVHVLFQPHLYSRTRLFARDFADALSAADSVVALDVYAAREDPEPGVDGSLVVAGVPGAVFEPDRAAAVQRVAGAAAPGDVVVTMGAGDVDQLVPDLIAALSGRDPAAERTG